LEKRNYPEEFGFRFKNARLHYSVTGRGNHTVLAFHGFGQNHKVFDELGLINTDAITLYSFDLFFHGQSVWEYEDQPIEKQFWIDCIESFITENNINRFSMIGFSIGCRFVVTLIEKFNSRINRVYLLAPDGIPGNFWYSMATSTVLMRWVFKSLVRYPKPLFLAMQISESLRLVNSRLIRFAKSQMDTEDKRYRVFNSWVTFRKLSVSKKDLEEILQQHPIKIIFIVGDQDQVIQFFTFSKSKQNQKNPEIHTLRSGHSQLIKAFLKSGLLQFPQNP
jgi:pimeloyl-ACP methyl ester carboxylesterase